MSGRVIDSNVDLEKRVPTVEGLSRSVRSNNGKRSVEESLGKLTNSCSGNSESKREQPRKREERVRMLVVYSYTR